MSLRALRAVAFMALLWLVVGGARTRPASAAEWPPETVTARITFYVLRGPMADGVWTHKDAAACSRWMPFGTQLMFPDGYVVTCHDRGLGDRYWPAWVDVWAESYQWGLRHVERDYGTYSTLTVIRWGWE